MISTRKYYLMMLPLIIGFLIYSLKTNTLEPLNLFIAFAITGIMGETLIDFWWKIFYEKPLWKYTTDTLYHGYTSRLNFVPWGLGGYLYWVISERYVGKEILIQPEMLILLFAAIAIQILIFNVFKPTPAFRFKRATLVTASIFYAPIIIFLAILAQNYGPAIYGLGLLFGVIPTIVEYIFGKVCETVLSKRLWNYTYLSIDRGHFTPLAIPLFCVCGFIFLIIGNLII